MLKVLFVCYGNICRSPMAEFLFKKYVKAKGFADVFYIESAATSSEELGNPVYPPAKKILGDLNIDCSGKRARKLTLNDYDKFDYLIGMDKMNIRDMKNLFGGDKDGKIYRLLDFADNSMRKDVADPWYTHDFETTKRDIIFGIDSFYKYLKESGNLSGC